jgi:hypothetical protein
VQRAVGAALVRELVARQEGRVVVGRGRVEGREGGVGGRRGGADAVVEVAGDEEVGGGLVDGEGVQGGEGGGGEGEFVFGFAFLGGRRGASSVSEDDGSSSSLGSGLSPVGRRERGTGGGGGGAASPAPERSGEGAGSAVGKASAGRTLRGLEKVRPETMLAQLALRFLRFHSMAARCVATKVSSVVLASSDSPPSGWPLHVTRSPTAPLLPMSAAPKPHSASSMLDIEAGSRAYMRRAVMPTFFARTSVYGGLAAAWGVVEEPCPSSPSAVARTFVEARLRASPKRA